MMRVSYVIGREVKAIDCMYECNRSLVANRMDVNNVIGNLEDPSLLMRSLRPSIYHIA